MQDRIAGKNGTTEPEFSRPVRVGDVPRGGTTVDLEASAHERDALAHRLGIVSVDRLIAGVTLERDEGGRRFLVRGHLSADLTQVCVITLEAFADTVTESFVARFDRSVGSSSPTDIIVELADDDPAEPIFGETIDLGELVAQYLALAIDPHPRRPGAEFDHLGMGRVGLETDHDSSEERSPFAALAALRGDRQR